jgi:hypothetical protein
MQYGLLTKSDVSTLEKTMKLVCDEFKEGIINTLEVGTHRGHTSRAINKYFTDRSFINFHTAVDNERDVKNGSPFSSCNFIIGNSDLVYNQIPDNSQCFIFIDASHSYRNTLLDFLLYSNKVRLGGYIAMHDTSPHINSMTDYQGIGDKDDPDNYISCRKAVKKLGLLDNRFYGWELVFDEYEIKALTGGVAVFRRIA